MNGNVHRSGSVYWDVGGPLKREASEIMKNEKYMDLYRMENPILKSALPLTNGIFHSTRIGTIHLFSIFQDFPILHFKGAHQHLNVS